MPLSMAALISGMMTLVATAPNLVVHAELLRQGFDGFGFFSFTPFGLPILGSWRSIRHLREGRSDFVLLDLPSEYDEVLPARGRGPVALLILALVVY